MKIAITTQGKELSSNVDPRFGRAKYFIVYDTETKQPSCHDNSQNLNAAQGAGIQAARKVVELGCDVLITGNVGPKAFSALKAGEIEVRIGAAGTVQEAIDKYGRNELELATEPNVAGHWS